MKIIIVDNQTLSVLHKYEASAPSHAIFGGLYFPVEIELRNGNIVSIRRGNGDMWDIVESKIAERMHAQTDHD